ncbi:MAG: 4Fe-4S binding protein [candidate division NC10 bacterium]|nr:4Fe-4S binding protein [candidate division NC10 bacterium]
MKVLKIIPDKCTGCMRCELACSYMQTERFEPAKSVIRVSPYEGMTSYAPYTCSQCAEGWCMTVCPVGAITISPVGAKVTRMWRRRTGSGRSRRSGPSPS